MSQLATDSNPTSEREILLKRFTIEHARGLRKGRTDSQFKLNVRHFSSEFELLHPQLKNEISETLMGEGRCVAKNG